MKLGEHDTAAQAFRFVFLLVSALGAVHGFYFIDRLVCLISAEESFPVVPSERGPLTLITLTL